MKAIRAIALPLIAIAVGCGMIVSGASIVRLSNVVENTNVVELPITIELLGTTETPNGDLPNYVPGNLLLGQQYDMLLSYTTTKALSSSAIIVQFSKVGINESDVDMGWKDGNPDWTPMIWTDNGDTLRGTLGYVGTQPAGSVVNYYAYLSYTVTGEFGFEVWVEGSVE